MNKDLHEHWLNQIRPLFPEGTEFTPFVDFEDFTTKASWRLNNDPERPNKRSKIIKIIIPSDVIDDYENKTTAKKQEDDEKLLQYVEQFINELDPNHDTPKENPVPEVDFVIGGNVLNS